MLGSLRLDFSSTVLLLKNPLPRLILNSLRIQNVEIGIPKNFCTDSTSTANAASSGRLAASAALVTMMPATVEPATGGAAINAYSLPNSREPTVKQISAIAAMANSEITTVFHSQVFQINQRTDIGNHECRTKIRHNRYQTGLGGNVLGQQAAPEPYEEQYTGKQQ